jgi:predicted transcriptional regulator
MASPVVPAAGPGELNQKQALKESERKWGKGLKAGWTAVPFVLLEYQHQLGLKPQDLNVLLHLLKHWWQKDRPPYPGKEAIAESMGVKPRTVQRALSRLREVCKLIRTEPRRRADGGHLAPEYHFDQLVARVGELADVELKRREQKRLDASKARTRRRPPRVVEPA